MNLPMIVALPPVLDRSALLSSHALDTCLWSYHPPIATFILVYLPRSRDLLSIPRVGSTYPSNIHLARCLVLCTRFGHITPNSPFLSRYKPCLLGLCRWKSIYGIALLANPPRYSSMPNAKQTNHRCCPVFFRSFALDSPHSMQCNPVDALLLVRISEECTGHSGLRII